MQNDYYKGCRVEISYPSTNKELFEKAQGRIEAQYAGAEVRGKGTDKAGADMMISLVFIPKEHPLHASDVPNDQGEKASSNAIGLFYDSASALIEEVMEAEKAHA